MSPSTLEHPAPQKNKVVTREDWLQARKELLMREKQLTRQRDEVDRMRRELPWVKVEKNYVFDGPDGKETLADLFAGRSQLIVSHFMFGPGWNEGCVGCSFRSDHVEGALVHLEHHDVSLVTVSRAPLAEIEAFRQRMGWRFKWVSSHGTDSTTTIAFPSGRRRLRPARSTTTTPNATSSAKKCLASAYFSKTTQAIFFIPTPPTGAATNWSTQRTCIWISRRKAATRLALATT